MFLRGAAGACLCAAAIGTVAGAMQLLGFGWPAGDRGSGTARIGGMPDDSGLVMLSPLATDGTRTHQQKKKPQAHAWAVEATGGQVVIRPRATVPAASATPVAPDDAVAPKTPAAKKTPDKAVAGHEVVTSGGPLPTTAATPAPAAAAASGLVRLSVRSVGVAPSPAGDPELQVKLGIGGAQPSDALPDSVTLHLRPQVPASMPSDESLALKAQVDMIAAQRSAPTDPSLRLRVRMTIGAAPAGTPMVQEPAGGDGKSNVIALTVGLDHFQTPAGEGPSQPGDPGGGGTPGTPGDSGPGQSPDPAPSEPTPAYPAPTEPAPAYPAPSEPTPGDPGPSEPTPAYPAPSDPPPADPAPADPAPTDPAPADPAPAPTDPAPTQPAPAAPTAAPLPIEIVLPVGPVRPVGGSTAVPVPPVGDTPLPDVIPIDVTVEQLPPVDPAPPSAADVPITAVQEPAPEVPAPPAAEPDPGTAPDASTPAADTSVVAYTADAGGAPAAAGS